MHSVTLPDFVNRWPDDMFPTPSTMDHIERKGMRPSRAATNRTTGYLSEEAVMWATPTVNDSKNNAGPSERKRHGPSLNVQAANMWPTPKSTRSGPDYAREGRDGSGGDDLATFVVKEEHTSNGGALNADWVEWLMGVPQGWSIAEPCADYDTWLRQQLAASHWLEEQGLPRTISGQENRVSRLKMLGNGIVPSAAAMAIKELSARLLQE